jgi:hypothetical protein
MVLFLSLTLSTKDKGGRNIGSRLASRPVALIGCQDDYRRAPRDIA